MKILWITNILLPPACEELGIPANVVGGWMHSSAKMLVEGIGVDLAVATIYSGRELKVINKDNITYYLLPSNRPIIEYNKYLERYWVEIKDSFSPDVIHIHGTEFPLGLSYINACGEDRVVISIQGLVSVISQYYLAGIRKKEIIKNISFRDLIKRDNIFQQQRKMAQRGELEREYIRTTKHIIGRTSWDKAHAFALNPEVKYHFCNETLRDVFYENKWSYDRCEKHTLFLSQAGYPIKGLHQLLKAVPYILREFPDFKIYIAGSDITSTKSFRDRIKISGYGKYIKSLIKKYKLEDKVFFTGFLNEEQICKQYLKANLFVCPSAIENSPNSLGEAQLLGMPFLSSYVGGAPDMVNDISTDLLYRFEEVEMLAMKVCEIFRMSSWELAERSMSVALARHNKMSNRNTLLKIYSHIFSK